MFATPKSRLLFWRFRLVHEQIPSRQSTRTQSSSRRPCSHNYTCDEDLDRSSPIHHTLSDLRKQNDCPTARGIAGSVSEARLPRFDMTIEGGTHQHTAPNTPLLRSAMTTSPCMSTMKALRMQLIRTVDTDMTRSIYDGEDAFNQDTLGPKRLYGTANC